MFISLSLYTSWNGSSFRRKYLLEGRMKIQLLLLLLKIFMSWAFIPEIWNLTFTHNLHTNVHRCFIHNSPKLEKLRCPSTSEQLNNLEESPGNYAEWEKAVIKGYVLYDSIYMTFLKWQNFRNGGQINGCQGIGKGTGWEGGRYGSKRATQGMLVVMELSSVLIVVVDTWTYTSDKAVEN